MILCVYINIFIVYIYNHSCFWPPGYLWTPRLSRPAYRKTEKAGAIHRPNATVDAPIGQRSGDLVAMDVAEVSSWEGIHGKSMENPWKIHGKSMIAIPLRWNIGIIDGIWWNMMEYDGIWWNHIEIDSRRAVPLLYSNLPLGNNRRTRPRS